MDDGKPLNLQALKDALASLGPAPDLLLEVWTSPAGEARIKQMFQKAPSDAGSLFGVQLVTFNGPRIHARPAWAANAVVYVYKDRVKYGIWSFPFKGIGDRSVFSYSEAEKILDAIVMGSK